MKSAPGAETPDWTDTVWPELTAVNFVLAFQGLGAVMRRIGRRPTPALIQRLHRASVAAVIATEARATTGTKPMSDDADKMALFSKGLDEHGGPDIMVPVIPVREQARQFWQNQIAATRAHVTDNVGDLSFPEMAHALVHGDVGDEGAVSIIPINL